MKKFLVLAADVALFTLAAVVAWFLRTGLAYGPGNFANVIPYIATSMLVAVVVFILFGLHRHFFRYFSLTEFYHLFATVSIAALLTILASFALFRLDGVHRAVPFLHWLLALGSIGTLRLAGRFIGTKASRRKGAPPDPSDRESVLLVGFTPLAELFLRSTEVFASGRLHVAGILDENPRLFGHRMRFREVIGHPEDAGEIITRFQVHGVRISRIILAQPWKELSESSRRALATLERNKGVPIDDFTKFKSFIEPRKKDTGNLSVVASESAWPGTIPPELVAAIEKRIASYGRIKRGMDFIAALTLAIVTLPLMLLLPPLIWLTMGSPVLFWQERPGRNGVVFRLYKFRTMKPATDAEGRLLEDHERETPMGKFLRRTRLDELPQLYNILKGDMSFIGPRPLLPIDLPLEMPELITLRNTIRPGLTGWAQVNGGKKVSREDKVILDIWYAKNMSFHLDLKILWLTTRIILEGDKEHYYSIKMAYKDLKTKGDLYNNKVEDRVA